MEKLPFTSYDFWAYLSAGFLLLFVLDEVAGTNHLMRNSWSLAEGTVAISIAYVVGQLVASASAFVFEKLLVGKLLGYPRDVLFADAVPRTLASRLFPKHFEALPKKTRDAALEKARKAGIDGPGEDLFWAAHAYGRGKTSVAARLDNFLNLYGFCRNAAFVAFVDAAILYWSSKQPAGLSTHLLYSQFALLIGFGMTLRYLKFFRHYALELFTSYAYGVDKDEKGKDDKK